MNFYDVLLAKKISGGNTPAPTLIEKTITENGVYNAADDNADGYSSVDVQVPTSTPDLSGVVAVTGTTATGVESLSLTIPEGVTILGDYAFKNMLLKNINNTNEVERIGTQTFNGCKTLTAAEFLNTTNIGYQAFFNCTALTTAEFPKATTIQGEAFYGCSSLDTINFPEATNIGGQAFYSCQALTAAEFPKVTSIGGSCFMLCTALITVDFKEATSIGAYAFSNCSALTTADFTKAANIGAGAFNNCSVLSELILRKTDGICTMLNTNAFSGTPFASGGAGGTLYVPRDLISSYQANNLWDTVITQNANNQILAIEDM